LTRVALRTLGCARNEVDSEQLAGRLAAAGFVLAVDGGPADVVVVNTCGFVEAAKQESIDAILEEAGGDAPVVAVGCLAERYGAELAAALPEATVLGFDDYPAIADRLQRVLAGESMSAHTPTDRRRLLPLAPADRPAADAEPRRRLEDGPVAPLKLASGCDRRCTFCAIPRFRGAFVSRPPAEVLAEAGWLVGQGVREVLLVSENSTSYGKDLGDLRLLEQLLPQLAAVPGLRRVRVSYLQPAEMRPGLVSALAATPGVAAYFDLSFQHASPRVLRRMRRFGGTEAFLGLLEQIRSAAPAAGVRSNVIVGFPGETEDDLAELEGFLAAARLDAIGVFGYSPEDGTEAAGFEDAWDPDVVAERVDRLAGLADDLTAARAAERVGDRLEVLVTAVDEGHATGTAEHQGPEDGTTVVRLAPGTQAVPGTVVPAVATASIGVDLIAAALPPLG
jgi:ribosomal protein S12 methylthiotransferase RimO